MEADDPDLVGLQPASLLAPSVVGELRHTDRPHRLGNRSTLRHKHVNLPKLRDSGLCFFWSILSSSNCEGKRVYDRTNTAVYQLFEKE